MDTFCRAVQQQPALTPWTSQKEYQTGSQPRTARPTAAVVMQSGSSSLSRATSHTSTRFAPDADADAVPQLGPSSAIADPEGDEGRLAQVSVAIGCRGFVCQPWALVMSFSSVQPFLEMGTL